MNITVSDHAVLRWLERVQGLDIEAARKRIRREVALAVKLGASSTTVDGIVFHLSGDTVVTCHPKRHK